MKLTSLFVIAMSLLFTTSSLAESVSVSIDGRVYQCTQGGGEEPTRSGCYCNEGNGTYGWIAARIHSIRIRDGVEMWTRVLSGNENPQSGLPGAFYCVPGNPASCNPEEARYHSAEEARAVCQMIIGNSTECRE